MRKLVSNLALLLMAAAPFFCFADEKAKHIKESDIGLTIVNGNEVGTECTDINGPDRIKRRLAIALASRVIVKNRKGVSISGFERIQSDKLSLEINEDSIGLIRPVIVVAEDRNGGDRMNLYCVSVIENAN